MAKKQPKREPKSEPVYPLREFRKQHGLSQEAASLRVGICQSQWGRIEMGLCVPRPRVAKKIAHLTGVPVEVMLSMYFKKAS